MNKLKRMILILIIMMLFCFLVTTKCYAALSCNVGVSSSIASVEPGKEFDVYVKISNLQTSKGIIAIGAVLEYDKNNLTFIDIEGQNKWSDPFYNEANGKITSVKSKLSTSNENVFKIKFKANDNAGVNAWVKISNFEISDGNEEKNVGGNLVTIPIKKIQNDTQGDDKKPEEGNKPNDNTQNNGGGIDNTNKPSTGTNSKPNGTTSKPNGGTSTKPNSGNKNKPTSTTNKTNTKENNTEENDIENTVGANEEDNNNIQNTIDEDIEQNNSIQNIFTNEIEKEEDKDIELKKQENKTKLIYAACVFGTIAIGIVIFYIVKYVKVIKREK